MFPIRVERGQVIQIKGGAIHHDSLIGKLYGSKVIIAWGLLLACNQHTCWCVLLGRNFKREELGTAASSHPWTLDTHSAAPHTNYLLNWHCKHNALPGHTTRVNSYWVRNWQWGTVPCTCTFYCSSRTTPYFWVSSATSWISQVGRYIGRWGIDGSVNK